MLLPTHQVGNTLLMMWSMLPLQYECTCGLGQEGTAQAEPKPICLLHRLQGQPKGLQTLLVARGAASILLVVAHKSSCAV